MIINKELTGCQIAFVEIIIIVIFAVYKLFASYTQYDINVFVEWEGAYRLYLGQVPFRDFGMPVGYVFWIIPALFFKVFGPYVYTLIIAQAWINLISNFTFWALLKALRISPAIRLATILIYCVSYSYENHWPWYNHSVFVFELIGLYFLTTSIVSDFKNRKSYVHIVVGGFFMALSMMTKQDVGGMGLVFSLILMAYSSWVHQSYKPLIIFFAGYIFFLAVLIVPFLQYEFLYWFNYGQPPHFSRISWFDFVDTFLQNSVMIKLYLLFVGMIWISKLNTTGFKMLLYNKREMVFALLTVGILVQAAIVQVTSYTPSDGNIYFHSFAFAYIVSNINLNIKYEKAYVAVALFVLVGLWWSGEPWKLVRNKIQSLEAFDPADTVVSRRTFIVDTVGFQYDPKWEPAKQKVFKRIRLPKETNEGIEKLTQMPIVKNNQDLKVLNMTELTPLAYELGYSLETGPDYPLWFHKGVAFFDAEVIKFCEKIDKKTYDLILFEDIPQLNQFYPYAVRDCIRKNYTMKFKFLAPRRRPFYGYVEVYEKQ